LGQDRLLLALSAPDAAAAAPAAPADPVAPAAPAAEEPKKKHELPEGLGGYGGPMISYLWMDLSPLEPMTKDRGLRGFDNGMLLIGGSGGVIKDNFFFGAFGFYGSQVINGHVAGEFADAEIALGGGGLIFELNSGKGKTGMAAGAMLGAGGIMLEADGVDLGPDGEWNAGSGVGIAYPYLGFWFAPTDWMFVQGDIGYMFFELDATGGTYWSKGTDMVDGQLVGGYMTNLKINFGTMGK
jgi:hypothetical protein